MILHQECSLAPSGCGFAVRSSLFCCCSINRCSLSLLLCSRITFVGSLNSSMASTSQPTVFSSHSTNSFWIRDARDVRWSYTCIISLREQNQRTYSWNGIHGCKLCGIALAFHLLILDQNLCLPSNFWRHILHERSRDSAAYLGGQLFPFAITSKKFNCSSVGDSGGLTTCCRYCSIFACTGLTGLSGITTIGFSSHLSHCSNSLMNTYLIDASIKFYLKKQCYILSRIGYNL